jgi:hypothetical protein
LGSVAFTDLFGQLLRAGSGKDFGVLHGRG